MKTIKTRVAPARDSNGHRIENDLSHLIEHGAADARCVHHQGGAGELVDKSSNALDHLRVWCAQGKPLEVADVELGRVDLGHGKGCGVLRLAQVSTDHNHIVTFRLDLSSVAASGVRRK